MSEVIIINQGDSTKVLKRTYILNDIINNNFCIARLTKDSNITIVTDNYNADIFEGIQRLNVKLYTLNPETYLILKNRWFDAIIRFGSTRELADALSLEIEDRLENVYQYGAVNKCDDFDNSYYFEKLTYPVDVVHNVISRGYSKYLVGINIGELEPNYLRPPVSKLVEIINLLADNIDCKIVLFGFKNDVRRDMVMRSFNQKANVAIFTDNYRAQIHAQAIDLCDIFISYDGFLMNLSTAIGKETIGLFASTLMDDTGTFTNLQKIRTTFCNNCRPCIDVKPVRTECAMDNELNDNCFYGFDASEILKMVEDFLGV